MIYDAKSLQAAFSRAGENAKRMRSSSETGKVTSGRVSDSPRPGFLKSLLTSLRESYNVLVTALEANEDVPKMENVTNCLLHEERKLTERMVSDARREGTMTGLTKTERTETQVPSLWEIWPHQAELQQVGQKQR